MEKPILQALCLLWIIYWAIQNKEKEKRSDVGTKKLQKISPAIQDCKFTSQEDAIYS